jgi:hypothetical protein
MELLLSYNFEELKKNKFPKKRIEEVVIYEDNFKWSGLSKIQLIRFMKWVIILLSERYLNRIMIFILE